MKVLLLIDALTPGGAETHVVTLARSLASGGHTVSVLSDGGALEGRLICAGVRCLHPPCPFGGAAWQGFWRNLRFLKRLGQEQSYDIFHAHTRRTALLLRLMGKRPFAARLVTCHARFSPRYRRLSYWGERTVAVSDDLREHLYDAFFLPKEQITIIPNGIDLDEFCPDERPKAAGATHVVFASRLDEDCSAAAFALIPIIDRLRAKYDVTLTIAGGGGCYGALSSLAKKVNARHGATIIRLTGALEQVAPLFRSADVFVGVSRAALEALGCGAAVILAGDEGFGGVLTEENFDRHFAANFCCRGEAAISEGALEQALTHLLSMPQADRSRLVGALRERIAECCDARAMAKATEEVYRKALCDHLPRRVLIGGYAGCGNLGDDAILRCLIDRARREFPSISLCATVADPKSAQAQFEGIDLIRRTSLPSLWREMGRADAFVLGGGCLLQNCSAHGNRSLAYYLGLLTLARLRRRPVLLIANGIGPLEGRLPRWLVGRALRRAARISVRDEQSRRLLISLGLSEGAVRLEDDPVLSLRPADKGVAAHVLSLHLPPEASGKALIAVAPRPNEVQEAALVGALRSLWKTRGVYPLLFAFDKAQDAPLCERIRAAVGAGSILPCEDERMIAALFAHERVGAVISGRLHALILSHVAKKEAVALCCDARDGKVSEFAASVGQAVLPLPSTAEDILRSLDGIINRQDE